MENTTLNIQFFDTIDSTNTEAARQIDKAMKADGLVPAETQLESLHKKIIVANTQTAGRGRLNRSFYSPDKTGIYMSLIWIPDCAKKTIATETAPQIASSDIPSSLTAKPDGKTFANPVFEKSSEQKNDCDFNPALYTATAAVGVCRAIKSIYGIDTKIKWVNDIYIGDKKICGILTEGKVDAKTGKIAALITGIGVNIAPPKKGFPGDLKKRAGAILGGESEETRENGKIEEYKAFKKRSELIYSIAKNVFQIYGDEPSFPNVMAEYREKSNLIGKRVTVSPIINQSEQNYKAEVLDITENAELKVKCESGEIKFLSSGEVSLSSAKDFFEMAD